MNTVIFHQNLSAIMYERACHCYAIGDHTMTRYYQHEAWYYSQRAKIEYRRWHL